MLRLRKLLLLPIILGAVGLSYAKQPDSTWASISQDLPPNFSTASLVGHKNSSDVLHISVSLPPGDQQGLQAFADSVSNPSSSNYRNFLTPSQVGSRFGLKQSSVQKVADYLTAQGMTISFTAPNRLTILATCTVAQAESAFHTQINQYSTSGDSSATLTSRFSYAVPPQVPVELQNLVTYIGGIDNLNPPKPRGNPITPAQFRTFYGVASMYNAGNKGQGRTIAISNFDGYSLNNVPSWISSWNLPTPAGGAGSNISIRIPSGDVTGNNYSSRDGEGDLDIQCVLGIAPLCNLVIYDAGYQNGDLIGVLSLETSDNTADIVTESYGWRGTSSFYTAAHNIHLTMTTQGITYMCASGDAGTQNLVSSSPDYTPYPDMDPEVLIVGGLTTNTDSNGNLTSQTGWSGSGGGWAQTSDLFNVKPAYQTGTGVPSGVSYRMVPDVALNADPNTPFYLYLAAGYYDAFGTLSSSGLYWGFGGTSAATPTFAACLADTEQYIIANGGLTADSHGKRRFGRINDLIYSFNGNSSIFKDITSGNNGTLPNGNASNAGTGWDTVTGWGQMIFSGLAAYEINNPTLTSVTVNPTTLIGGSSSTGTVTISQAAGSGGAVINLASNNAAATVPASVTVASGATTATFTITTTNVASAATATITASNAQGSVTAALTVNPVVVSSVTLNPTSVTGGSSSTGTVTLNAAAPTGGATVTLSSSLSSATVPASVSVAAGATSATFTVSTTPVATTSSPSITATYQGGSSSATLTINAPTLVSVTVSPTSVLGGTSSTGTVTLNGAAPTGGTSVTLSSNSANATVPASVTVAAGATTATFTVTTTAVASSTQVTLTGTLSGTNKTTTLTITPAVLSSVSLSPTTVTGGTSSTGTVTLNGAAGTGGTVVNLSSSSTSATVPASVTVPAGSTSVTFTVSTTPVSAVTTATITGTQGGSTQTATLTINAPTLSSVTVSPTSVVGGTSSTGTVTLNGTAPTGGETVSLSSSSTSATVPASVTVAAGSTTATFTVSTTAVSSSTQATITGILSGTSKTATLTVNPPSLVSLSVSPTSVLGGTSSTGTVTLNGAAPTGGMAVTLSSSSTSATVPASVTVAAGATTATFTVNTTAVASSTQATITGSLSGINQTVTLTVNPPTLSSVTVSPTSVLGGTSSTGTVTLNGAAPTGGMAVTLSSSSTSATVPASVTVAAGATTATFTVTTTAVATSTQATITGTLSGTSQTATLTINVPTLSSVTVSPASVLGGTNSTGTVTLNGAAPTGGMSVALSSSSTNATVPATVTVTAGATTATFTVTTTAVATSTQATLTGTLNGTSQTTTLTVTPATLSSISLSPATLVGGTSTVGTVTLNGAAGTGGTVVNLSSNSTSATVPASVTVPAGSTSVTFTVSTASVSSVTTVTITGTQAGSTQTATLTVNPAGLASVSLSPSTVVGGNTSTGTVTLGGPAGASGAVVNLTSQNAGVTVPASVTVASGATTATFTINTAKSTQLSYTNTITATYAGSSKTATLTVQGNSITSLTLNPTSMGGNGTSTGTVTLAGPAPAGGWTVTLAAGYSLYAKVPASVTVPAGATTATFSVTAFQRASTVSTTVKASDSGSSATATITITGDSISSITLNPTTIGGGESSTATVTLTSPAPVGGWAMTLSAGVPSDVTMPSALVIPAGATSGTFTIAAKQISTTITIGIYANDTVVAPHALLTINGNSMKTLVLNPSTIGGDQTSTATITLNSAAPSQGWVVNLKSGAPTVASLPASITIPAGATSGTFSITAHHYATSTGVLILANDGVVALQQTIQVLGDSITGFTINPLSIGGNQTATGTVTLAANAPPGGWLVNLKSSLPNSASVPATIDVPAGSNVGTFTITAGQHPSNASISIYAYDGVSSKTVTMTVLGDSISSVTLSPSTIGGNGSTTGTVTLATPAPAGGWAVTVKAGVAAYATITPASFTIPAGSTTGTFTVTSAQRVSTVSFGILASDGGSNQSATLTVTGDSVTGLTLNPTTIGGSQTSTGTVTLSAAAPQGGWVVKLTSAVPSYVSVPASITIPQGSTTGTFTLTPKQLASNVTVGIYANDGNSQASSTITINGDSMASFTINPSTVVGGTGSTGTITLKAPAPAGGWTVSFKVGAPSLVSVPATVVVPEGATTVTFPIGTKTVTTQAGVGIYANDGPTALSQVITITPN